MNLAQHFGLRPKLDVIGVLGIVLGCIYLIALIWALGTQTAYWAVGFLP